MNEGSNCVLAYQRTPIILLSAVDDFFPESILSTCSDDEIVYLRERSKLLSDLFYELIKFTGSAGCSPSLSPLFCDLLSKEVIINSVIDGIHLPVAEQPGTKNYVQREYYEPFWNSVNTLFKKTELNFSSAKLVHLTLLPNFYKGNFVSEQIVFFDKNSKPSYLYELYLKSRVSSFKDHLWIGVNIRCTLTNSMFDEIKKLVADKLNVIVTI